MRARLASSPLRQEKLPLSGCFSPLRAGGLLRLPPSNVGAAGALPSTAPAGRVAALLPQLLRWHPERHLVGADARLLCLLARLLCRRTVLAQGALARPVV